MTKLHAEFIGDRALLPRAEFERLVELARRSDDIELQVHEDDVSTLGMMRLGEQGRAFDWLSDEPELYTVSDLKVR